MQVLTDKIAAIIEPTLEALGFELVRVAYGGGDRAVLQIMAERPDGSMSVDDCARISRELSVLLDVEDPIETAYTLEVSSPGVDRPLTRLKDFERWAGFDAKVELLEAVDGRRRFRGRLAGTDGDRVRLSLDGGEEIGFAFDTIAKAKLVMTDELLAAAAAQNSI